MTVHFLSASIIYVQLKCGSRNLTSKSKMKFSLGQKRNAYRGPRRFLTFNHVLVRVRRLKKATVWPSATNVFGYVTSYSRYACYPASFEEFHRQYRSEEQEKEVRKEMEEDGGSGRLVERKSTGERLVWQQVANRARWRRGRCWRPFLFRCAAGSGVGVSDPFINISKRLNFAALRANKISSRWKM